MAAGIRHGQRDAVKHFLRRLHIEQRVLSLLYFAAARVDIDAILGVDQVAFVLEQPVDAVVRPALLARRQSENHVAVGYNFLGFEAQQRRDEHRRAALLVLRASTIEVAVLLRKHERIVGPIRALRLDDVEMRQQQHRLVCARSSIAHDQIAILDRRTYDLDVRGGEPRVAESIRELLSGSRRIAARGGGVRLDQLAQDRVAELVKRRRRLLLRGDV